MALAAGNAIALESPFANICLMLTVDGDVKSMRKGVLSFFAAFAVAA